MTGHFSNRASAHLTWLAAFSNRMLCKSVSFYTTDNHFLRLCCSAFQTSIVVGNAHSTSIHHGVKVGLRFCTQLFSKYICNLCSNGWRDWPLSELDKLTKTTSLFLRLNLVQAKVRNFTEALGEFLLQSAEMVSDKIFELTHWYICDRFANGFVAQQMSPLFLTLTCHCTVTITRIGLCL